MELDISYNRVRVLSNLDRVLGNIITLNLSHNNIESLDGLGKLYSLEVLNVGFNRIDDACEAAHLCRLPCLDSVVLEGNPIAEHAAYRVHCYVQLSPRAPQLDGAPCSQRERAAVATMLRREASASASASAGAGAGAGEAVNPALDHQGGVASFDTPPRSSQRPHQTHSPHSNNNSSPGPGPGLDTLANAAGSTSSENPRSGSFSPSSTVRQPTDGFSRATGKQTTATSASVSASASAGSGSARSVSQEVGFGITTIAHGLAQPPPARP